jgi:hypothetical protein
MACSHLLRVGLFASHNLEGKELLTCIFDVPTGSVDLLLHLLSSIVNLPVTKATVKESGMGKAIGSVEKHSQIKGTLNEPAVKERVQQIKDAWNASVKERKLLDDPEKKRSADAIPEDSPASPKRVKVEVSPRKSTSFSTLLKKVSSNGTSAPDSGNGKSSLEGSDFMASRSDGSGPKRGTFATW